MNAIKSMNRWANQLSQEPLPVKRHTLPAGQSALWKYKAIYHQGDDSVGQWCDVVSIPVAGETRITKSEMFTSKRLLQS